MAFCTKCGSKVSEGAAFCVSCGTPMGSTAPARAAAPAGSLAAGQRNQQYSAPATGTPPPLVTRVTNILTKPKQEWPVIHGEAATVANLYTGYIVILAAIPVLATLIKSSLIGTTLFGVTYRVGIASGLVSAVITYALTLGGVYVAAFIIEKLAPSFQSQGTTIQALQLVAYAYTASWVAGVFGILPVIGILGVLAGGIYSIYLFYLGLPVMMKTPQDKVIVYMIVAAVVTIVISLVIGLIVGLLAVPAYLGSGAISN